MFHETAMSRIFLLSCVSKKLDTKAAAEDLYVSDWFKKAKVYAKMNADRWYILSAKYGLVDHRSIIEPYEHTLNNMKKQERLQWADQVLDAILANTAKGDTIVILAGVRYRQYIMEPLLQHGYIVEVPLESMGIGKQLSWLSKRQS